MPHVEGAMFLMATLDYVNFHLLNFHQIDLSIHNRYHYYVHL